MCYQISPSHSAAASAALGFDAMTLPFDIRANAPPYVAKATKGPATWLTRAEAEETAQPVEEPASTRRWWHCGRKRRQQASSGADPAAGPGTWKGCCSIVLRGRDVAVAVVTDDDRRIWVGWT